MSTPRVLSAARALILLVCASVGPWGPGVAGAASGGDIAFVSPRDGELIAGDVHFQLRVREGAGISRVDVYVAGTLMFPEETAEQDARARRHALAHGVFVAVASFAGPTGEGYDRSAGASGIWTPDGEVLAQAGPERGGMARATLLETVSAG